MEWGLPGVEIVPSGEEIVNLLVPSGEEYLYLIEPNDSELILSQRCHIHFWSLLMIIIFVKSQLSACHSARQMDASRLATISTLQNTATKRIPPYRGALLVHKAIM